jgi:cation diffusion facilitator family transporter
MAINMSVMQYERRKGQELRSDMLTCDALHTRSDIFASIVVLITLVSIKLGFSFLDTIVAVLIAILITKSGIEILKHSSNVLCDASVIAEPNIAAVVNKVSGVKSVHGIRTRGRGDDIHVDLHVTIDAEMHVDDAHKLSHKIESILKKNISGVTDVIVHIEPSK